MLEMSWKKKIKNFVARLVTLGFKYFPEGALKNRIRCFKANRKARGYRLTFRNKVFVADYGQFQLRFPYDPCSVLPTNQLWLQHSPLKPGDYVVDAGAHLGGFTLLAAKLVGNSGRVLAFEPDSEQARQLKEALELNGLHNVEVREVGLWSNAGTLRFYRSAVSHLANSFVKSENSGEEILVPVSTLDEEIRALGWTRLDLLKMNVEGAEAECLKGASRVLGQFAPSLAIATDHWVDGQFTDRAVEEELDSQGFEAHTERIPYSSSDSFYMTTYGRKRR